MIEVPDIHAKKTLDSLEDIAEYLQEDIKWPGDVSRFLNAVSDCPENCYMIEIGSLWGKSLIPMAMASKLLGKGRVISIDIDYGCLELYLQPTQHNSNENGPMRWHDIVKNAIVCGVEDHIIFIGDDSKNTINILGDINIGLLNVDGGHDYTHAFNDIKRYGMLLVKNGIILVDDCYPEENDAYEQYKGVTKAVNELIINSDEYTDIEWEKDMGVLRAKKV
tara:strand:+ start:857 stop:1519 length:663 start_codon:yes stop_codon:yes gene_type:complete